MYPFNAEGAAVVALREYQIKSKDGQKEGGIKCDEDPGCEFLGEIQSKILETENINVNISYDEIRKAIKLTWI